MLSNYRIISLITNFLSTQTLISRFIFSSSLDEAIERYETKKPTDLAADAKNVISPKEPARNRSSSFKGNQSIEELFDALNQGICQILEAIGKKIHT